jgi:hypothetical protein
MPSTRGITATKTDAKLRLGRYEALLTNHGGDELVDTLAALMQAVTSRLGRKPRGRRGRRERTTA